MDTPKPTVETETTDNGEMLMTEVLAQGWNVHRRTCRRLASPLV